MNRFNGCLIGLILGVVVGAFLFGPFSNQKASPIDIARLADCIKTNTCQIPRRINSDGIQRRWSVELVTEGVSIQYLLGMGDSPNSMRVLVSSLTKNDTVLMEDSLFTGQISRVTFLRDDSAAASTYGTDDKHFKDVFLDAQDLYALAIEKAKEYVIPATKNNP